MCTSMPDCFPFLALIKRRVELELQKMGLYQPIFIPSRALSSTVETQVPAIEDRQTVTLGLNEEAETSGLQQVFIEELWCLSFPPAPLPAGVLYTLSLAL